MIQPGTNVKIKDNNIQFSGKTGVVKHIIDNLIVVHIDDSLKSAIYYHDELELFDKSTTDLLQ